MNDSRKNASVNARRKMTPGRLALSHRQIVAKPET